MDILVEYSTKISQVIAQTFQTAQRIKLTSFDVSQNFIIFGASSGGIYVFKREPCEFIKLIPSKEGSATKLLISPNEKNIAIASSKGLIIVLENFFVDLNLRYQVYNEHENHVITALKWQNSDLYSGDNTGKICVITLMNILTKAIFQSSSSSLMHLDSRIVQLDVYSKFLLVSTQSRTFLCNTEKEQYRQIGKKLRDGSFGACFFNTPSSDEVQEQSHTIHGLFKVIKDNETGQGDSSSQTEVKIYCARPGARLWEANFGAGVVVTHQFRGSFQQSPSKVFVVNQELEGRLKIESHPEVKHVPENFCFHKLLPLDNKFLLTFDSNGIYVFDPNCSRLVFWCCSIFKNIRDVVISEGKIFVWQSNMKFNVLALKSVEELIVEVLVAKQYLLCADLCENFVEEVLRLIESSQKIHLISILKSKLLERKIEINGLEMVFEKLEEIRNNTKLVVKKLNNGIVVVENSYLPVTVEHLENVPLAGTSKKPEDTSNETKDIESLLKQYKLNKIHSFVEITEVTQLYERINLNDLHNLFMLFIEHVQSTLEEDSLSWCQNQFLKQAIKLEDLNNLNESSFNFLESSFIKVNNSKDLSCECTFPLPKAHQFKLQYSNLIPFLMAKTKDYQVYLTSIPFLHKYHLDNFTEQELQANLPLLIQFSHVKTLQNTTKKLPYDSWDESLKLLLKLFQSSCLNCNKKIDNTQAISWSDFSMLMVQSIGPQNAIKLLKRNALAIKGGELTSTFYQTCIFACVMGSPKNCSSFIETNLLVDQPNTKLMFAQLMDKFLQKKHTRTSSLDRFLPSETGSSTSTSKCTYCKLSLNAPIIGDVESLQCGHSFHRICVLTLGKLCNICVQFT